RRSREPSPHVRGGAPPPPAAGVAPMPEDANAKVTPGDPSGQPAVKAWRELRPERGEPHGIEVLAGGHSKARKRSVYLTGVGRGGVGGGAVIARRCKVNVAMLERTLYEEVLPHLPVPRLRYYGFVAEAESRYGWLFLEDAGGEEYSALLEGHRALAGRWLGL